MTFQQSAATQDDVLVRVVALQQETLTTVLNIDKPSYVINKMVTLSTLETMFTYIELGFEHIIIDLDHLLFVACLVYISGNRKKLLFTITSFTLAHSMYTFSFCQWFGHYPNRAGRGRYRTKYYFLSMGNS